MKRHLSKFKEKRYAILYSVIYLVVIFSTCHFVTAEDWCTYMHDNQRSGVTGEELQFPLTEQWRYISRHAPQPAWSSPAKTDYWHRKANLKPRVIYDRAYQVVVSNDKIYFGTSSDDKVYCLEASTGKERWSFFAAGPIRLAPSLYRGNVYVGSDDGVVYCLDGDDGNLIWKFRAFKNDRILPGNERMVSIHPVRTGVLVENDIAYFCSGMFPNEGVTMVALNAGDGSLIWKKTQTELSPQGYLLASATRLYVPTGRTTPVMFNRENGKRIGAFKGNGGTYALLYKNTLIYGSGDSGELEIRKPNSEDQIASFNGLQIIVTGETSYLRSDDGISAIDRSQYQNNFKKWNTTQEKKRQLTDELWDLREQRKLLSNKDTIVKVDYKIDRIVEKIFSIDNKIKDVERGGLLWKRPNKNTFSMILAGEVLFVGGDEKVDAIRKVDGKLLWTGKVTGKVYGLAVANGCLFVSTDRGTIHCFSEQTNSKIHHIRPSIQSNPFSKDNLTKAYTLAAKQIIKEANISKGYCLIIGCNRGRLAYELARRTDLKIVGIEQDAKKVLAARKALDEAGFYGSRVTVHHGSLTKLPYTKYFANLIVSDQMLISNEIPTSADEVFRVLRPYGGVAYFGDNKGTASFLKSWLQKSSIPEWKIVEKNGLCAVIRRGDIPGSGEWTHLYADAANTSCSMDSLRAPLQVQWFGRPGPHHIINRHSRPMSPLFKNGRLFIPADNRIICIDAYNGTLRWELDVPHSRRLGALKDCGHIVLSDEYVYIVARDKCQAVDVVSGKSVFTFKTPQVSKQENHEWGYLSCVGNQIFGSGKKVGASFYKLGRFNSCQLEGDFRDMILSDYLFSLDRHRGKKLWIYRSGVIFNSTIAISDDHIFFIESRNSQAVANQNGRLRVDIFCKNKNYLVKLNRHTGKKIWEKAFQFPFQHIMFLSYAKKTVLVSGSFNVGSHVHYSLYAFDSITGEKKWENSYRAGDTRWNVNTEEATIDGEHGEQWQHPVIIGETIYLPPYDFNLQTGKKGTYYLTRGGHGCGGISGAASYLFARGSNPRIYNLTNSSESGTPLTCVNRPGCWINIIPAGGLVLIPESSSGCTCDYPVQTSFVFVPTDK